jgi:hypothetical protein
MKLVLWMLAGSVVAALAVPVLFGVSAWPDIWLGMLGPLVSAAVSWLLMERQHRIRPEGLMALMIKAFGVKMVFFAAYLAVVLTWFAVQPIAFAFSFAGYFLALHIIEAFGLHGLQAAGLRSSNALAESSKGFMNTGKASR